MTDADDDVLRTLRREVIEPYIADVVDPADVRAVAFSWGVNGHLGDVWLRVNTIDGDSLQQLLVQEATRDEAVTAMRSQALADIPRAQLDWWGDATAFPWSTRQRMAGPTAQPTHGD